ncbi:MAG: HAD family hydrolase [Dehalococcoidia bacterium]|nr:HAD family hydrolase [Dehalococcoidia bacterium]
MSPSSHLRQSALNLRASAASSKRHPTVNLPDIRAVAFDGYGTLINFTEPDFIVTMAEICARQGLQADAADLWRRFLRASFLLRSENHRDPVYRRYDAAWAIQFERVFKRQRLPGDAWDAANYLKAKLAEAPAFDEAHPVIEALRPHYRIALLSNADDDFLHACLARNGLHFDVVLSSEQAGAIKPNPLIFLRLAELLGLPPAAILYAGDNPIPDVLGPARAGMTAAWVNRAGLRRPRRVPPPYMRVRSLSELLPLLVPPGE